jgi:FkbM family methyltransferase
MNSSAPMVIFGAGNLGRRVARAIRPALFCDSNSTLWGTAWEGVPIESPETAVRRYPNAIFVVAIWHPSRTERMADRIHQLKSLGASDIIPFSRLLADYGDFILPNMLWERPDYYAQHQEEIDRARALLDPEGRDEFDRQMRLRLGDPSNQVIDNNTQYFQDDVFQLSTSEVFIDCGAYDGDTIAEFRRATGDQFIELVAFEPDPQNFAALKSAVNRDPRIKVHPYATGRRRETVRFTLSGTGSRVSSSGSCEVQVITLDEALDQVTPTYIKMDIEGSEPDAIVGASQTISRYRPKMAVCVYHAPDHLWTIPLQLDELLPDSRFTMRTYCGDGFDCVCYCIPR